jgi:hypothetical protein
MNIHAIHPKAILKVNPYNYFARTKVLLNDDNVIMINHS